MLNTILKHLRAIVVAYRRPIVATMLGCLLLAAPLGLHRAASSCPAGVRTSGLIDQNGVAGSLDRWHGRIVVLNFFYTMCTTACPVDMLGIAQIQRALPPALRSRVEFVSVSIDPQRDDPAILRAYAQSRTDDLSNWTFLSGAPEDIRTLARAFAITRPGEARLSRHSTALWLLDGSGRVVQRYSGTPIDARRIAREITDLDGIAEERPHETAAHS